MSGRYDIALKSLFSRATGTLFETLTGVRPGRLLNTELVWPQPRARYVDLLVETEDGHLIQIEFQSLNDKNMGRRMFEYGIAIWQTYGRVPIQVVLYVGQAPMKMEDAFAQERYRCEYRLIDVRDLDGAKLLNSADIEDNLMAVLTRGFDNRDTVLRVIRKISVMESSRRSEALQQLTALSGLRTLEDTLKEEAPRMPIVIDIRENKFFAEAYEDALKEGRQAGIEAGREEGFEKGREAGLEKGLEEGRRHSLQLLKRMLELHFGVLPVWVEGKLHDVSNERMETLTTRAFRYKTLEEVFD